jgi:hypothetical protein
VDNDLAARLARVEAHLAIEQLAVRYAMAVDARDLDLLSEQWVPDVWMGKALGEGREAVRTYFASVLQGFHRSVHMVVGHRINLIDDDHATGSVYCRAEHESVDTWVVQAIVYEDVYRRVAGRWGFAKRVHHHWYSWPIDETPAGPTFEKWPHREGETPLPDLPHLWPSWKEFWAGAGDASTARFTNYPDRPPTP